MSFNPDLNKLAQEFVGHIYLVVNIQTNARNKFH